MNAERDTCLLVRRGAGIRQLVLQGLRFLSPGRRGVIPSVEATSDDHALIGRIKARNLTYLSDAKLVGLATTCRAIEAARVPGLFLEAGCALGGSAILLALLKHRARPLQIYDVFGIIPPPTDQDSPDVHSRYQVIAEGKSSGIGGDPYYGYVENLQAVVLENLASFGVQCEAQQVTLIKGLVQDTLHLSQPVAFAHVDVDWYEPVLTCLRRIFPRLVVGGSIILDDYHDWGGCRKATDVYLAEVAGQFACDDRAGSMKVTRVRKES